MQKYNGFTLVELMIVVAILGVLTAIALPAYRHQAAKASTRACMYEAKGYGNSVAYALFDQDDSTVPVAPLVKSCKTITDASGWTIETMQKVVAKAKLPSKATIECDLPKGVPCRVLP